MGEGAFTVEPLSTGAAELSRFGRGRWAYFLIVLMAVVIGASVYLLGPDSAGGVQVVQLKGLTSPADLRAIRRELRRIDRQEISYSFTHLRFKSLWEQISILGCCRLVKITTFDNTAIADYKGHSWKGKSVTIQRVLNKGGQGWSCTTTARATKG